MIAIMSAEEEFENCELLKLSVLKIQEWKKSTILYLL